RHGESTVAIFGNAEIRGETFDSQSPVLFSPLLQNFCCLRPVRAAINDTRFPVVVGLRREGSEEFVEEISGRVMHRNEEAYFRPPGKLTCLLPLFFKSDLIRLVLRDPGRVTILWRRRQRRRERRRLGRRSPKPLNAATHPRGFTRNSFRRRATYVRT